uniref:Uncharacterized protein n=1 Tax=Anguilla anguilla TaxID=7936 RepID=A0A0E9XRH5_ANGAN
MHLGLLHNVGGGRSSLMFRCLSYFHVRF